MAGLKLFLARMNGWMLSLVLHGGIALLAGVSVFTVHVAGGSGSGSGGSAGGIPTTSFAATLRDGDEPVLSGTVLPELAQFGRLTSEETILEPIAEAPALPPVPFDVFAVGSADTASHSESTSFADPLQARPGAADGRSTKLPPASTAGNGQEGTDGSAGLGGSGGGEGDGNGSGEGSGEGNATGVFTPAPVYPNEARRRNIEGSVLVELAIASDGSCTVRRIVESSGFTPLDNAVESAISTWKYRSADDDGRPATTTKRMRFTFKLGR